MTTAAKGLEGVVIGTTAISRVDGANGRLIYRGYEIAELAGKATYEEVCHLLWAGHLPSRQELDALDKKMRAQRAISAPVLAALRALPSTTHPMDAVRTGASMVGAALPIDGTPTQDQAIALTARFATLVA